MAVSGLAPGWTLAAGRPQLSDDVLRISVNEANGRIGVGTTGGDPVRSGDEDRPLVYNPEMPETSFTSFRIDGEEAIYGHAYGPESAPYGYFVQEPVVEGDRIVSVWRYRGVDIRQTVELVPQGDKTLPAGNARLSYRVDNKSGKSVKLGTRILLDVKAGDNDGPLLMAPGELTPVIGEREFGPAEVPLYWQAMDDVDDPQVVAYGTLYGFGEKKPSRVIFGHWNGLSATKWKYDWNQWTDYTADGGALRNGGQRGCRLLGRSVPGRRRFRVVFDPGRHGRDEAAADAARQYGGDRLGAAEGDGGDRRPSFVRAVRGACEQSRKVGRAERRPRRDRIPGQRPVDRRQRAGRLYPGGRQGRAALLPLAVRRDRRGCGQRLCLQGARDGRRSRRARREDAGRDGAYRRAERLPAAARYPVHGRRAEPHVREGSVPQGRPLRQQPEFSQGRSGPLACVHSGC
ncbi:hypothetical protein [Cohnella rhizosphaerae]|uniref:Uncharacterized protein n=1 Tax=Cohnella rhizosphaerae TaxID=1457232 RepID=A0A9X4KZ24_9BACL|nr:hypothetical protein [Cohnella rhizosphaerae]MDG0813996.1 hypothetical protein [Cohnella rhizosphaerae]